ncbi:uncharacterized protein An09g06030 [Aspergillus niger]|uniref:Contig An09c0190, genomic contig n=3 Tax=Aspergillus niger TaxID=5061 RepID=A2QUL3_ASPNC|nr:uncharacterized protein An09g06030 [Aspergillus niger]CAK40411.1 unnamed protein product [Aspergillus niger]
MLGGTGLSGRGVLPAVARQRLYAFSRSSRSVCPPPQSSLVGSSTRFVDFALQMSSFRPQTLRTAVPYGQSKQTLLGTRSWRPATAITGVAAARFNSTSSAPSSTTVSDPAASDVSLAPQGEVNLNDLTAADINAIPEQIGYLKQLGLDFGWGFSSMIEYSVEHFHIMGGLPWWGAIVATGLFVRLGLLYPTLMAADTSTKLNNIKHLTTPLRTEMVQANYKNDLMEATRKRAELSQLHKDHGIKPWKAMIPMIHIPFGFGCYRVVNNMCSLPVPGLTTEHVAWLQDLTVSDPYYILPLIGSVILHHTLKKGGETGMNQMKDSAFKSLFLYGMPTISFLFMANFPGALQLYFLTTSVFALGQTYLLSSATFRKMAGITLVDHNVPKPDEQPKNDLGLRLINEVPDKEAVQKAAAEAERERLSLIDRTLGQVKETGSKLKDEMQKKVEEYRGSGPTKNADGTVSAGPRLSEKDRKLAEDYERRRSEEEAWKREERNHARREAHLRAMELQRQKAAQASRQ